MRSRLVAFVTIVSLVAAPGIAQAPPSERVTLDVEVLTRDPRPVIPCGHMGAQPRDVSARVLSVVAGHFEGDTIELSWPMCEFSRVSPGARFQIRIRRRTDRAATPATRYRVRDSRALSSP